MVHKRSLQKLILRRELRKIYDQAFYDRERAEIVAMEDHRLLDIARGEVLRSPRYTRVFWIDR